MFILGAMWPRRAGLAVGAGAGGGGVRTVEAQRATTPLKHHSEATP